MTEEQTQDQPDFELRAKQRKARRIDKRKVILLAQAFGLLAVFLIVWSFSGNQNAIKPVKQELATPDPKNKPEGLDRLPSSYDRIKNLQELAKRNRTYHHDLSPTKQAKLQEKAHRSALFFPVKNKAPQVRTQTSSARSLSNQLNSLSQSLDRRLFVPGLNKEPPHGDQLRKLEFLSDKAQTQTTSAHHLQKPNSPYMLMAGSVISASLITGLNSDLPGQVLAQVTEPVYDTATGKYLLIPQGAKLLGTYDSRIAYAQNRALIKWQRLILPNGSSVILDNLPATDPTGKTGLHDRVDHHEWQLIKGVALATVLSIGTELTFGAQETDLIKALRQSTQSHVDKASDRIIKKQLEVQPTLKIRPGWPLKIIVTKDIIMKPYR